MENTSVLYGKAKSKIAVVTKTSRRRRLSRTVRQKNKMDSTATLSAFVTAVLETLLYAFLSLIFAVFRFLFTEKDFYQYSSQANIKTFSIVFLVVLVSVFFTRLFGGTSLKEIINKKSKKNHEISTTMFVGGLSGFITYLILNLFF